MLRENKQHAITRIQIEGGLRQCGVLNPVLFNIVMDSIIEDPKDKTKQM